MAGALYIWIMGAIFLGVVILLGGFALVFWLGHRMEKKETGAKEGFLELPDNLRSQPAKRSTDLPTPGSGNKPA